MKTSLAIGLMSGSSLDGLDLALVRLTNNADHYSYQIETADTLPYPKHWQEQLSNAFLQKPEELTDLDKAYGSYLGQQVAGFIKKSGVQPDFVASHGHTVFHKPEQHYTLQIGDGQALADACGMTVVNDFRSEDVRKGGQGAPLVPIGDQLLFDDYEICLNIGGIANVSYDLDGKRIAYDICIANQALNWLAQRVGFNYDKNGIMAREGHLDPILLEALNNNGFYSQKPPKSLGREFFETFQKPILASCHVSNALTTFVEHIAIQIARTIEMLPKSKMLITGGGALNSYLVERIAHHTHHQVVVPDRMTIDYKEALIFAFLGLLRLEGRVNVLSSVTGAPSDSCSGKIWHPKSISQ